MCGQTLQIETLSLTDLEAAAALWAVFLEERRVQEARRPRMQHLLDAAQAALSAYEAALNGESDPQDPVARALRQTVQQRQQELHKLEGHAAAQAGSLNALLQKAVKGNGMLDTVLEMPAVEPLPEWLAGLGIRDDDIPTVIIPDWVAGLGPTDDDIPAPVIEAEPDPKVAPDVDPEPAPTIEPDATPDAAEDDLELDAAPGDADFAALFNDPDATEGTEAAPITEAEAEADPVPAPDDAEPAPTVEPDPAPDAEIEEEEKDDGEVDPWLAILGGGGDPF